MPVSLDAEGNSYPNRIIFVKKSKAETDNVTTNDYRREVNYQKMGIAALCVNMFFCKKMEN